MANLETKTRTAHEVVIRTRSEVDGASFKKGGAAVSQGFSRVAQGANQVQISSRNAAIPLLNMGQIFSDMPYGIRGVANNLDYTFISMQRFAKQAGGWSKAIKAMAMTLAGPTGLAVAVSALTALWVAFGPQIREMFTGEDVKKVKEYKKKIDELRDSFDDLDQGMNQLLLGEAYSEHIELLEEATARQKEQNEEIEEKVEKLDRSITKAQEFGPAYAEGIDNARIAQQALTKDVEETGEEIDDILYKINRDLVPTLVKVTNETKILEAELAGKSKSEILDIRVQQFEDFITRATQGEHELAENQILILEETLKQLRMKRDAARKEEEDERQKEIEHQKTERMFAELRLMEEERKLWNDYWNDMAEKVKEYVKLRQEARKEIAHAETDAMFESLAIEEEIERQDEQRLKDRQEKSAAIAMAISNDIATAREEGFARMAAAGANAARDIISQRMAEGISGWITKALTEYPPWLSLVLAPVGAAAATLLYEQLVPSFRQGGMNLDAGFKQVHKDEFIWTPPGSSITSQSESRGLVSEIRRLSFALENRPPPPVKFVINEFANIGYKYNQMARRNPTMRMIGE